MKHVLRNHGLSLTAATATAFVAGFAGAWPSIAAAAGPAIVTRESQHKYFATQYEDDGGICRNAPPAWVTSVVTDRYVATDMGDGTFNITNNGTSVEIEQFHDFRGGLKISVHHSVFVVDGVIRVHYGILNCTGCP